MKSIITAVIFLLLAFVVSPERGFAQVGSEVHCPLNSVSESAAAAWRTRTLENANRIREALRIYNLQCLQNIVQFVRLGWYQSVMSLVINRILNRICQTVMPGITLTSNSMEEFLGDPANQSLVAGVAAGQGVSLC